jgi:Transglutaminase-like superfamily
MVNFPRDPIRFLSKALLALDLVLWLFWLPVRLHIHAIPMLLKVLARSEKHTKNTSMDLRDVVDIVMRISNLRLFHSRIFPKLCLRQSLALYRTLSQMGYPIKIHFGVMKDSKNLHGHSWVTLQDEPIADTARNEFFRVVYSYPMPPESGRVT